MKFAAALSLLLCVGCAAKKHETPTPKATLTNCVQVSIDAKTKMITVVCPLPEVKK
jgi:predicted outer membrane protein